MARRVLGPGEQLRLAAERREQQKRKTEASLEAMSADHRGWVLKHAALLRVLPAELAPSPKHGQWSYTCSSPVGNARVEVLLRDKAFFVKGVDDGMPLPKKPRVRWDAHGGPQETWAQLRQDIGWRSA